MNIISKTNRVQLVFFVLLTVAASTFAAVKYVQVDRLLGFGVYEVTGRFADSGGIFTGAEVTYRGTPVGRVGTMTLTPTGVDVVMQIDKSAPRIPADALAVVANRSAIGEQYVDLQPSTNSGPYLADGSAIEIAQTRTPTATEDLLMSVNTLAKSVPTNDLRTLVTELGTGFAGTGDSLQTLLTSLGSLSQAQVDTLPQTLTLIRDATTVLGTQSEQSSSIGQFAADLDAVTAQLRSNDPDVRRLIDNGIPASQEVGALTASAGGPLTTVATDLNQFTTAIGPRAWILQPFLVNLAILPGGAGNVAPGDRTIHQGVVLEVNNPPPCTVGYQGTYDSIARQKALDPNFNDELQDFPLDTNVGCATPLGSVTGVRGANRLPFADPQVPQPWDDKPKQAPVMADLNPIASQLAPLLGVTVK